MAYINAINNGVGTAVAGQYQYSSNSRTPVTFKNVGEVTVYIGSVPKSSGTATIDTQAGYPLLPGQVIELPGLLASDSHIYAFNTAVANSALRIVSLIEN